MLFKRQPPIRLLIDAYIALHANYAGAAFMPTFRKSIFSQSALGGAAGAAAVGNPMAAVGLGVAAGATSPRLTKTVVNAALQSKAFVAKLSPAQRGAFLKSPEALTSWASTVSNAAAQHQGVANQLVNQGMQQVRGGR
jgi:hypothetical protein